jgi:hypothetical protein
MKSTLLTLALAAAATAAPTTSPGYLTFSDSTLTKRDPTADQIFASINAWINDVHNVNQFLNVAPTLSPSDLAAQATTALGFANDEPTQLTIESDLSNLSDAGKQAVSALKGNFGNVITSLQGIIAAPGDAGQVLGFLEIINGVRCSIVLPSLDILWPAAADASGAPSGVPAAERPQACNQ